MKDRIKKTAGKPSLTEAIEALMKARGMPRYKPIAIDEHQDFRDFLIDFPSFPPTYRTTFQPDGSIVEVKHSFHQDLLARFLADYLLTLPTPSLPLSPDAESFPLLRPVSFTLQEKYLGLFIEALSKHHGHRVGPKPFPSALLLMDAPRKAEKTSDKYDYLDEIDLS
jgi:hypothetical protein